MDQQRRLLLFFVLSMMVYLGWEALVVPALFPNARRKPVAQKVAPQPAEAANGVAANKGDAQVQPAIDPPADAAMAENAAAVVKANDAVVAEPAVPAAAKPEAPAEFPVELVKLGSSDPASPYFMLVTISSAGAAVESIELNDPRYREALNRQNPLKVVGNNAKTVLKTFATAVPAFDLPLAKFNKSIASVGWEIDKGATNAEKAVFRLLSADGALRLTKTYTITPLPADRMNEARIRDRFTAGYQLGLALEVENLSAGGVTTQYQLQGPVGVPLEDPENTTKFRDIRIGFLQPDGKSVDTTMVAATEAVDQTKAGKVEVWTRPLRFIGVDVQYFAALVQPLGNQVAKQTIAASQLVVVEVARLPKNSDLSTVLQSTPISLGAGEKRKDDFALYAGPKRQELLAPFQADSIVDFGWLSAICVVMLGLLNTLNDWGVNYGIAIMLLTAIVRGMLFPFSRKQVENMERMKELQPKIKELQAKYAKDREAMGRAQMELFAKNNYNPFAGCWPILLQMPIFFALYRTLNSSIDLRMASFLWIDNLAAPDRMFQLPFVVPFLEWTEFNLLPFLTIALFVFQQKAMMPPPTDPEQEMQHRMMTIMTVVMGVLFYRVPAGLCIYFIFSSVWGMAERYLLQEMNKRRPKKERTAVVSTEPSKPTFFSKIWAQLQEAADKQAEVAKNLPANTGKGSKAGK